MGGQSTNCNIESYLEVTIIVFQFYYASITFNEDENIISYGSTIGQ